MLVNFKPCLQGWIEENEPQNVCMWNSCTAARTMSQYFTEWKQRSLKEELCRDIISETNERLWILLSTSECSKSAAGCDIFCKNLSEQADDKMEDVNKKGGWLALCF